MIWKKHESNLIVAVILSIIYAIVTLLIIVAPLHINSTGGINQPGVINIYAFAYFVLSLILTWGLYISLRKKPEALFFTLTICGIVIIIAEIFLLAR